MSSKEYQIGSFVNHYPCPECSSQDNLTVYKKPLEEGDDFNSKYSFVDDEGVESYCDAFCQTPNCGFKSSKWLHEHKVDLSERASSTKTKEPFRMTEDLWEQLMQVKELPHAGWVSRGVPKEIDEFFGVTSKPVKNDQGKSVMGYRYYPSTKDGKLTGYHVRNVRLKAENKRRKEEGLPTKKGATFFPIGLCNSTCELFGQHLFNKGGRMLVIANGEEGAMAAYSVLKTNKYETPCVSATVGEGNAYTQIKNNFEFVSSFDKVVIALDDDKTGRIGAEQIARLLKPSQAYIAKLPKGDCQDYVKAGLGEELKRLLVWDCEQYSPAGIVGSSQTLTQMKERASFTKVALPDFAEDLQKMLNGGFALGEITTVAAASSSGKTTVVNEFLYNFVMNSPYKVGVISLESDVGELTENLMSVHLGKKLANMEDEEKLEYYETKEALDAYNELTSKPDGSDRYYILDHQGAVVDESLMEKIEYLVKVLECKVIVLDPLTLALSGKNNDGMDIFMSELLRFVKREKIHHINVVHVRKNSTGAKANSTGADLHEEDIKGSGSIFQVSMNNILLMRDKENPDPVIRNTTKVVMSKARRTGNTGPAGYWLYNNETARLQKGKDPHGDYTADEELFAETDAYNEADIDELLNM